MSTTVYIYDRCGTCRKALKWLDAAGISYTSKPIRETPPSTAELNQVLAAMNGEIKKLFNTSSKDYREAGIKDCLATISKTEAFKLLQDNGNLVKRPFVVHGNTGIVGFKEDAWKELFK